MFLDQLTSLNAMCPNLELISLNDLYIKLIMINWPPKLPKKRLAFNNVAQRDGKLKVKYFLVIDSKRTLNGSDISEEFAAQNYLNISHSCKTQIYLRNYPVLLPLSMFHLLYRTDCTLVARPPTIKLSIESLFLN